MEDNGDTSEGEQTLFSDLSGDMKQSIHNYTMFTYMRY